MRKFIMYFFSLISGKKENFFFPGIDATQISPNFKMGKYRNVQVNRGSIITIENNVHFREFCNVSVSPGSQLIIRKNVFFNNYCSLNCLQKIEVGENTLVGEGVKIYDHNHQYNFLNKVLSVSNEKFNLSPVIIGKNCWIGSNVTILKGVEIGDNVIIGANNLVYRSVPSGVVIKSKADYFTEEINS